MHIPEFRYLVIPKASLRPDKFVFYNQFIKTRIIPEPINKASDAHSLHKHDPIKNQESLFPEPRIASYFEQKTENKPEPVKLLESNRHGFELSHKAKNKVREKVTWLYTLAKNKTAYTWDKKVQFTFKMNFITLTMPSMQKHATSEITKECLNQFLTECREKFGLKNYVWRLEFQKNGNAHYHIATDSYIPWHESKLIWNRCLNRLGYVDAYSQKFRKMPFALYCRDYSNNGKIPFNTLKARYSYGCAPRS